jgi:hypothetical protein
MPAIYFSMGEGATCWSPKGEGTRPYILIVKTLALKPDAKAVGGLLEAHRTV